MDDLLSARARGFGRISVLELRTRQGAVRRLALGHLRAHTEVAAYLNERIQLHTPSGGCADEIPLVLRQIAAKHVES